MTMQRHTEPFEVAFPAGEIDMRRFAGGTITGLTGAGGSAAVEQKVNGSWVPLNKGGSQLTQQVTLNEAEILSDDLYHANVIRLTGITGTGLVEPKS